MKSCVFKMSFCSPVHFGMGSLSSSAYTCGADTFFSAVLQEWLKIYRNADELLEAARNGEFRITDLLPFCADQLYIPKPILFIDTDATLEVEKKEMKSMRYIPKDKLKHFIDFLKHGGKLPFDGTKSFATPEVVQKVVIQNGESTPFSVATFRFKKDAGLYFAAEVSEGVFKKFLKVMDSISDSGIGGERSSGYGKFLYQVIETEEFSVSDAPLYLALSAVIPTVEDLNLINQEHCSYILSEKGGFVDSNEYADRPLKKQLVTVFDAGSTFDSRLSGRIVDVSQNGGHAVYKYGFGFYLGVDLS